MIGRRRHRHATIWAFIIPFAVFVYVVMDGSILASASCFRCFPKRPIVRDHEQALRGSGVGRQVETWLVLGGGGLMGRRLSLAYGGADAAL